MDVRNFTGQMINFNKATIDNSFSAMVIVWEQMEKMTGSFLNQLPGLPAEGKRAVDDWMKAYREGCDQFKKTIDENFKQLEAVLKPR